ncbi:hypothetical protein GCM10010287_46530 [Streptomyces variabilis]|uniref:Uncharacterized protein n=1 Tax=Streptomyces variabilis TaxID=67372 RepID=A0ABQ2U5W1_9ACTN|nr:hypothetical protein GCM10010265_54430 [Streptomyces griseoincarnatus]GGT66709.1 hypothetical protein GCM10010287_46530 [Streptomyces variabilis]
MPRQQGRGDRIGSQVAPFGCDTGARRDERRDRREPDGSGAGNTEAVSPLYGADTALWWTVGGTVTRGQYFGRRNHSALARFAQNTITRIDTTQMTRPSR